MRVLHIATWYPNRQNSNEALFIQKHTAALSSFVSAQKIIHINTRSGQLKFQRYSTEETEHFELILPTKRWFLIEITASILLAAVLLRYQVNKYDLLNAHIAYPNLTYLHLFKRWIKIPIVITEHWSAYHSNFGLKRELPRIKNIFQRRIPVITVSKSLGKDILNFSKVSFRNFVIPNVVDNAVFYPACQAIRTEGQFFMVSRWKDPKKPLVAIDAFNQLLKEFPGAALRIGGYGPQLEEMKKYADNVPEITFLGVLNDTQIADEMRTASAFVHPSDYETFSVVCAEALACGCPVIASRVGGIPEFVNEKNGLLVEYNSVARFYQAMRTICKHAKHIDDVPNFSKKEIGIKYYEVLGKIIDAAR